MPAAKGNKFAVIKFLALFAGTLAVYYGLYASKLFVGVLTVYINITTAIAGLILKITESDLSVTGNILRAKSHELMVGFGCDGSEPIALFVAGVVAYPAKAKQKLLGGLTGIVIIYILNLFRIVALFYAGKSGQELLELLHNDILPVVIVFISILLWIIWLKWASRDLEKASGI